MGCGDPRLTGDAQALRVRAILRGTTQSSPCRCSTIACLQATSGLYARFAAETMPRLLDRDRKAIQTRLLELTRDRHSKYGDSLFHLEPNIKDCPGGLRDAHVVRWLRVIDSSIAAEPDEAELKQALEFLHLVRCFLHYRHDRDDNILDWQAQDAAAESGIGLNGRDTQKMDAAVLDALLLSSCAEYRACIEAHRGGSSLGEECTAFAAAAGARD